MSSPLMLSLKTLEGFGQGIMKEDEGNGMGGKLACGKEPDLENQPVHFSPLP